MSMRWFGRDWINGDLSDAESDDKRQGYMDYLDSVSSLLPPKIMAFARPASPQMSIHDGVLDAAVLDQSGRRIDLYIVNGDAEQGYGLLHLVFVDADVVAPTIDELSRLLANRKTEFLYHELEIVSSNSAVSYEVRFILWPDGVVVVQCAEIVIDWHSVRESDRLLHRSSVDVIRRKHD